MEDIINRNQEYILKKGAGLNQEIKNNIYLSPKCLINLLLMDYVNDTLKHYDRRNCPGYTETTEPIIPENNIIEFITEAEDFIFKLELDPITLITEGSDIDGSDFIEDESGTHYFESESDYINHMFDLNIINSYLKTLIKDIEC